MRKENQYYDQWLTSLKSRSPILTHPDKVQDAVMRQIESTPRKKNNYLLLGSGITGLAATYLLCLLFKETVWMPTTAFMENPTPAANVQVTKAVATLSPSIHVNFSELQQMLMTSFRQRKLQQEKRILAIKNQIKVTLK